VIGILALAVPCLGIIVLANFGERHETARLLTWITLWFLVSLAFLLALGAILTLAWYQVPPGDRRSTALTAVMPHAAGTILAGLSLFPPVRRALARAIPIRPDSPVHVTALVFTFLFIGSSAAVVLAPGYLSTLAQSPGSVSRLDLIVQALVLCAVALAAVGLGVRRGWRETRLRLGLVLPTLPALVAAVALVPLFVGASCAVDQASKVLTPGTSQAIDTITSQLLKDFSSPVGALVFGLAAGISEELLFRGALVPRLGVLLSAVLFATAHSQYGVSLQTAEVLVFGVALGILRQRAGTSAPILTHAVFDTTVVLLTLFNVSIFGCS
jgi:membrane protease YdiL (CAAX protease family)